MGDFSRRFLIDPGIPIKEDPNIIIKEEPLIDSTSIINTTASVPIPVRRVMEVNDYRDFGIEFENSQSPLYQDSSLNQMQIGDDYNNTSVWGSRIIIGEESLKSEALIHMDDDDIFQVDKADLIQGPTLAELNANDDTLLGDLNFDDLLLPEEGSGGSSSYLTLSQKLSSTPFLINTNNSNNIYMNNNNNNHNNNNNNNNNSNNNMSTNVTIASSCPQSSLLFYKDLDLQLTNSVPSNTYSTSTLSPTASQNSSNSPLFQSSPSHVTSTLQQKHSTLHELLMKRENYVSPERNILEQQQSLPEQHTPPAIPSPNLKINHHHHQQHQQQQQQHRLHHQSRLSSSAPTHLGLEQLWQRREPRKHLKSTGSMAEAGSTSSISTGGILSPDPQDFSNDEFDSDDESDGDQHYEDVSSDNDSDNETSKHSPSKKERYFWQYNVQAKGPKGQRLVMKCKMEDPHVLNEITDPVFSPDCSVRGIKHSGKARKGDGNDLTPNARKLYSIGKELDKLGRIINDMTPVSELPFNIRPKSRKEKNKLASRACRLKKKAQHEANKIKLSGLEVEHKNLFNGIMQCKDIILAKLQELPPDKQEELSVHIDNIYKVSTKIRVAGTTTEYVNKILDKLKKGPSINEDG